MSWLSSPTLISLCALLIIVLYWAFGRHYSPFGRFLLVLTGYGTFACLNVYWLIRDIHRHDNGSAGLDAFFLALDILIIIWAWHNWRNDRKRILALIGAKSRALRDKLVRRMAEQGAGA